MLAEAPSIKEVIRKFDSFIDDSILVGHNVCFDAKFVSTALGRDLENALVDTMRISRHVNKDLNSHKLESVYNHCISEGAKSIEGSSHRAEYDARATFIIYEHMKQPLIDLYGEDPGKGWKRISNAKKHSSKTKRAEIVQTVDKFDDSNPFYGMHVCFTGKMNSMTRNEAWQKLVNLGGIIEESSVRSLDYLVVGNDGFISGVEGNKSTKNYKSRAKSIAWFSYPDYFREFLC